MTPGPSQYVQSSTEIWSAVASCVSQVASHVDKNLIGWDFGDFCLDACDWTVVFNPAIHNLRIENDTLLISLLNMESQTTLM